MRLSIVLVGILLAGMLVSGAIAIDDEIENLLTNPDFESGTQGWSIGAEGQLSIDNKEESPTGHLVMMAAINAVGADDWVPEIHSPKFDVDSGEKYTVDFWAKTEPEVTRTIGVKFEQDQTWVGPATTITLTDEWQLFVYSPVMTMDSPPQVVIHIQFNKQLEDVWFCHFRVYEGEYVEEDIEGQRRIAVTPVDRLTTAWGKVKSR
jgi:hypothetical protein